MSGTDYIARQKALKERREAEGYYTPEAVAKREEQAGAAREYNESIAHVKLARWSK